MYMFILRLFAWGIGIADVSGIITLTPRVGKAYIMPGDVLFASQPNELYLITKMTKL